MEPTCGKRFYRWGVPKPDRLTQKTKGWGSSSAIGVCEEWADQEKSRYDEERRFHEVIEKGIRRHFELRRKPQNLKDKFSELAEQWRRETRFLSSSDEKILHPAYQSIIAMGQSAVPLVLEELRSRRGHWFWALRFMADADPVPDGSNIEAARQAWIAWGREQGYLT